MTFLENARDVGRTLGVLYTTQIRDGQDPDTIADNLAADIARFIPQECWDQPCLDEVQRGINEAFVLLVIPIVQLLAKIN